jgi:hypothetical protein
MKYLTVSLMHWIATMERDTESPEIAAQNNGVAAK